MARWPLLGLMVAGGCAAWTPRPETPGPGTPAVDSTGAAARGPIALTTVADANESPWTTSFGGQLRYRFQREDNEPFEGSAPVQDDIHLLRARLHGRIEHESGVRAFAEVLDARLHDDERPATPIDRQNADVHQLWGEVDLGASWRARLGRIELSYGAQRLVSPLDWGNTRRRFEGGLARWEGEGVTADLFVTRPVVVDPRGGDEKDGSRWFSGLYTTWTLGEDDGLDVYGLALAEVDDVFVAEGGTGAGDHDRYTIGARVFGEHGAFDYEVEAARQTGRIGGDPIRASAGTARVGWTFRDVRFTPRVGLDVDHASGDDDPTDGRHGTFDQLFPLGHAYLGSMDLVGRQNVLAYKPNLTLTLHERATLRLALHAFRLAEAEDALYGASGAATLVDPTGAAGRDVGEELDVTLALRPACWPGTHVLLGWSRFDPGRFVETLGGDDDDAHLAYLQITFDF